MDPGLGGTKLVALFRFADEKTAVKEIVSSRELQLSRDRLKASQKTAGGGAKKGRRGRGLNKPSASQAR